MKENVNLSTGKKVLIFVLTLLLISFKSVEGANPQWYIITNTGLSIEMQNVSKLVASDDQQGFKIIAYDNHVITTDVKKVVFSNSILGDTNRDGTINVSDVVTLIGGINNTPLKVFNTASADINFDDKVNSKDVTDAVSYIMKGNKGLNGDAFDEQDAGNGQFMVSFFSGGKESYSITKEISFEYDETSNSFYWKPAESTSDLGITISGQNNISNIKCIIYYLESENTYRVSLPEGSSLSQSETFLRAYGQNIAPTEGNDYLTGSNTVSLVNKDGKIIYDCYASLDTHNSQHSIELNAMETAYTYHLPLFPGVFDSTPDEILQTIKKLLSDLPETQALAVAIDNSIIKNGYVEEDDIATEYQAAVDCVIDKLGLRNNYLSSTTRSNTRAGMPHKPYVIDGNDVWGLKLVMNSSEWHNNGTDKWWKCNFTAYNSNRFAYTAWLRGYKDGDGLAYPYQDSYDLMRKSILKPQRVSTFMDTFTDPLTKPFKRDSWDGLSDYFSDSWRLFTEDGFGFDDMTWDNTKTTFDMSFLTNRGVVIVAGPADNQLMMYYNVLKSVIDPIIKKVAKKLVDAEDDDYMLLFCIDLVADEDYRADFSNIINSNKTYGAKAKDILVLTWPKMRKFLDKYLKEQVETKSLQYVWDHWGFMAAGELQKAFEDIGENWNKWLSIVEKTGDVGLGLLGLTEGSFYYDLSLDFDDSEKPIPVEGLVAYYPFNGNPNDLSGHGNDGILCGNNPPALTTDRFGRKNSAYELGGFKNYNYIRIPNSESLKFDKEMTISFWLSQSEMAGMDGWGRYSTSEPSFAAICKAGDGNATYPGLYIMTSKGSNGNGLNISTNNSNGNSHSKSNWNHSMWYNKSDYKLGGWLHLSIVVNNTDKILYVDGVEVSRDQLNKEANFSSMNKHDLYVGIMASSNMTLGRYGSGAWYPFYGKIDDIRVYNRALDSTDIWSLYNENIDTAGGGGGGHRW